MKRTGHLYEELYKWENLVEAEKTSTKRKLRTFGVITYARHRFANLVHLQEMIMDGSIRTGDYEHEQRKSGQDKVRDIAKLKFYPNHIYHKVLTDAVTPRLDKALINNAYASRKGYGQTKAALHIRDYLRKHKDYAVWYAQADFTKYYDNIRHEDIRVQLERIIKDKRFIDAFLEPFEKFAPNGVGIPLGINPSQAVGNMVRMPFDRYAVEEVKCHGYTNYLDDFVFFGKTKGEVKGKMKKLERYVSEQGYNLHKIKIHRVSEGLDILGYVFYPTGAMYWRKSDKKKWLKRRSKVTNKRRIKELDAAAWGMLKWGNRHCKRLYEIKTEDMGVKFKDTGIKRQEKTDSNGVPFIDRPRISMGLLLNKPVTVKRWVKGVSTKQGANRYCLEVEFADASYKLIVNSVDVKSFIDDVEASGVTEFKTVFYDKGQLKYAVDDTKTEITKVEGREIEEVDGDIIFTDNKEKVNLKL